MLVELKQIALDSYDRIVGLLLEDIAVDGCITNAPGGGECVGPSPAFDVGTDILHRMGTPGVGPALVVGSNIEDDSECVTDLLKRHSADIPNTRANSANCHRTHMLTLCR